MVNCLTGSRAQCFPSTRTKRPTNYHCFSCCTSSIAYAHRSPPPSSRDSHAVDRSLVWSGRLVFGHSFRYYTLLYRLPVVLSLLSLPVGWCCCCGWRCALHVRLCIALHWILRHRNEPQSPVPSTTSVAAVVGARACHLSEAEQIAVDDRVHFIEKPLTHHPSSSHAESFLCSFLCTYKFSIYVHTYKLSSL